MANSSPATARPARPRLRSAAAGSTAPLRASGLGARLVVGRSWCRGDRRDAGRRRPDQSGRVLRLRNGRLRRRCRLLGDGAGDGIEPLLQHGDARIEPVAIGVQRLDGGGEPSGLVLALLGQDLEPVGLAREIGGRNLVAPPAELGLVGEHGNAPRRRRPPRPTSPAATSCRDRTSSPRPQVRRTARRSPWRRRHPPVGRNPLP